MKKTKKLIIIGLGETADIAYEYFTHDSNYEVCAFSVNQQYIKKESHFNLPIVAFEEIEKQFSNKEYETYVAISYVKLNRVRKIMYLACKAKGYTCANYISSKAFVWHNVTLGENIFIFENNVVQHQVKIGNNVILWSGNHIGHQTTIEDHVYIASHAVISGFCSIGSHSFIGVNATFNDNIKIAADTIVGSAAVVVRNMNETGKVLIGSPAKPGTKSSYEAFQVEEKLI
jgi:sugar O-acyltransferase (sialic acid O-acetyltransferase NeuD family)